MDRTQSELESFVLGLVWQLGPCSAYDVRKALSDSPSSQWSGSAGAIYPLMSRLERRRLLASKEERNGKRARRSYRITPAGIGALRQWVGPPLGSDVATVVYDPLRSRARFLSACALEEQLRWVGEARLALEEVERRVRHWNTVYGDVMRDPFVRLVARHGELDLAMRRAWLRELETALRCSPEA